MKCERRVSGQAVCEAEEVCTEEHCLLGETVWIADKCDVTRDAFLTNVVSTVSGAVLCLLVLSCYAPCQTWGYIASGKAWQKPCSHTVWRPQNHVDPVLLLMHNTIILIIILINIAFS